MTNKSQWLLFPLLIGLAVPAAGAAQARTKRAARAKPQKIVEADRFGVKVYEGARLDAEQTKFLRVTAGADGYCFRTKDGAEKVAAFYQQQPGLTSLGLDESGGLFVKEEDGRTVNIKIESPWKSAENGKLKQDTLITIIRE